MNYEQCTKQLEAARSGVKSCQTAMGHLEKIVKKTSEDLMSLIRLRNQFKEIYHYNVRKAKIVDLNFFKQTKNSIMECETLIANLTAKQLEENEKLKSVRQSLNELQEEVAYLSKIFGNVIHHDFRRNT
jgi:ABC-type Fe3+-citrate transport system substrate-binding protein